MWLTFKRTETTSPEKRREIAERLAVVIKGEKLDNVPYMPNEGDDSHWVLNRGNDWFLTFSDDPERSREFEIRHRYQAPTQDFEGNFAWWLENVIYKGGLEDVDYDR